MEARIRIVTILIKATTAATDIVDAIDVIETGTARIVDEPHRSPAMTAIITSELLLLGFIE